MRPLSWAVLAASLRRATPLHVNTRRGIGQQLCTAFTSVAAPALATMDGSLHALPSKPAPGLDDMDGSLYNLRAFG